MLNNGAPFTLAGAPSIGILSSNYSSTQTSLGRRMPLSSSSSFRERPSNIMTSRRSRILMTLARRENFALQGWRLGFVIHGMEGFDYERARVELRIPEEFQVEAMAAVGKPAPKEVLPEKLQKRESPSDRRKVTDSI